VGVGQAEEGHDVGDGPCHAQQDKRHREGGDEVVVVEFVHEARRLKVELHALRVAVDVLKRLIAIRSSGVRNVDAL